jgi:branched-subunit amino acid transport protein
MSLVTYLTRAPFLVFSKKLKMPDLIARSLKYIPAAILATLIFPGIFAPNGELAITVTSSYIWAAIVTAGIVLISKNSVAGIVSGMISLVLLRQFF